MYIQVQMENMLVTINKKWRELLRVAYLPPGGGRHYRMREAFSLYVENSEFFSYLPHKHMCEAEVNVYHQYSRSKCKDYRGKMMVLLKVAHSENQTKLEGSITRHIVYA